LLNDPTQAVADAALRAASLPPKGTVFKITRSGVITLIYTAPSGTYLNGAIPFAGLLLGSEGFFYGTTYEGGIRTACNIRMRNGP
jgi:hypothetical protein